MTTQQSVIVIGAGIVGICCAIELRRRGLNVTVLDKGEPGAACSFGNAGILAAQSCAPFALPGVLRDVPRMMFDPEGPLVLQRRGLKRTLPWVMRFLRGAYGSDIETRADAMKALYGTTQDLHARLALDAGVPELIEDSHYLYLFKRAEDVDVEAGLAWRLRRDRGADIEVFDGSAAIREIEPAASLVYQRAVRLGPVGRTTNPFRLTQAYAALLQRMGGVIEKREVHALRPGTSKTTAVTDHGEMSADKVIVAAGSWTLRILKSIGVDFPLIAERGYHMTFADPGVALKHVCNDPSRHAAISMMEMGLRIAGTEELGDADTPPNWRRADVLKGIVSEMFPTANLVQGTPWMGPRPGTPDSLPVISTAGGHPNIFIATGHGHLGLTGAPMTGRIISALVTEERLNMDLSAYSATRFK